MASTATITLTTAQVFFPLVFRRFAHPLCHPKGTSLGFDEALEEQNNDRAIFVDEARPRIRRLDSNNNNSKARGSAEVTGSEEEILVHVNLSREDAEALLHRVPDGRTD